MMFLIKSSHTKSTGEATGEAAAEEGEVGASEAAAGAPGKAVREGTMGDQQKQHVRCFSTIVSRQYLHKPSAAQELSTAAVHNLQQAEVVDETTWV